MYEFVWKKKIKKPQENKSIFGLLWLSHVSLNFFQEGKLEKKTIAKVRRDRIKLQAGFEHIGTISVKYALKN